MILLGLVCLRSGQITQDPESGGPPLEGSLAHFGALVIIVSGVAFFLIAYGKKPSDQTKTDDHE